MRHTPGLICSQVVVPLDRTGQVPGHDLAARRGRSRPGDAEGAIFLIAGGPGQGSAHVFGLDNEQPSASTATCSPATRSSPTTTAAPASRDCWTARPCRSRSRPTSSAPPPPPAPARSARRAPSTAPPSTPRISRPSASRSASTRSRSTASRTGRSSRMAYALAHPDHVERLVLDSVLPPERPDPYSANDAARPACDPERVLLGRGLPGGDEQLRRRRRRGREPAGGQAAQGKVLSRNGKTVSKRVDGLEPPRALCWTPTSTRASPPSCPRSSTPRGSATSQPLLRLVYLHDRASGDAVDRAELRALRGNGLPRRPVPMGAGDSGRQTARRSSTRRWPRFRPGRSAPSGIGRTGSETPTLRRLAQPGRRGGARNRPAARRSGAGGQRRLRHAHADRRRARRRLALPPRPAARRPWRGPQHGHGRPVRAARSQSVRTLDARRHRRRRSARARRRSCAPIPALPAPGPPKRTRTAADHLLDRRERRSRRPRPPG